MINKAFYSILFITTVSSTTVTVWAQEQKRSACARTLQLAQSVYQRGDIHRIPYLLKGCLNTKDRNNSFTKQEKVEALKILALSHTYREEPEKADEAMLNLLKTDHFFKINEAIDPKEFIAIYETFRTYSLFSVGLKIGPVFVIPNAYELFYGSITGGEKGSGSYSLMWGFQAGLSSEIPLFRKPYREPVWMIVPEVRYTNSAFAYNAYLTAREPDYENNSAIEAIFSQERVQLDVLMRHRVIQSIFNPYVGLGLCVGYLLSSKAELETQFISTNNVINGPSVDFAPNFNTVNAGLVASVGTSIQLGGVGGTLMALDVRYQYGFVNALNQKSRINTEAALDYGYVLNNFRQSSIMVSAGFSLPIFAPKKLSQKKLAALKVGKQK